MRDWWRIVRWKCEDGKNDAHLQWALAWTEHRRDVVLFLYCCNPFCRKLYILSRIHGMFWVESRCIQLDYSFSHQFQLDLWSCVLFRRFCNIVVLWLIPFAEFYNLPIQHSRYHNYLNICFNFCLNSSVDAVYFLVQSKVAVSFYFSFNR